MRRGRWLLSAVVTVVVLMLPACGIVPVTQVTLSGRVLGEEVSAAEAGKLVAIATPATVECNGATTRAAADGRYALTLHPATTIRCTLTPSTPYVALTAAIPDNGSATLVANFDPAHFGNCARDGTASGAIVCPGLRPEPGSLAGVVTSADTHQPLAKADVTCWNTIATPPPPPGPPNSPGVNATTDAQGHYALTGLPVGTYACAAQQNPLLFHTTVAPAASATLDMTVCHKQCPPVASAQGHVMHHYIAYVIFWLPGGYHFEPQGNDARFEALVHRYFLDVGGTPFFGLLSQYWDVNGPVENSVRLGGTYMDTHPYPHAGSESDPLQDRDIQTEIDSVRKLNGWSDVWSSEYFVLTGYGVNACNQNEYPSGCTFENSGTAICGYHGDGYEQVGALIYAYIDDGPLCDSLPAYLGAPSPNGDSIADSVLNTISHEQFESISDPLGAGWTQYPSGPDGGEIGDLCEGQFGSIQADGRNVTLGSGHGYLLQEEWSNVADACALS